MQPRLIVQDDSHQARYNASILVEKYWRRHAAKYAIASSVRFAVRCQTVDGVAERVVDDPMVGAVAKMFLAINDMFVS
jgi:hypothetical protein